MAKLTFSDEEQSGPKFELVPEGTYRVMVFGEPIPRVAKSGNQMLVWTLRIAEGRYEDRQLKHFTVVEEGNRFGFFQILAAINYPKIHKRNRKGDIDIDWDVTTVPGMELLATVIHNDGELADGSKATFANVNGVMAIEADDDPDNDDDETTSSDSDSNDDDETTSSDSDSNDDDDEGDDDESEADDEEPDDDSDDDEEDDDDDLPF